MKFVLSAFVLLFSVSSFAELGDVYSNVLHFERYNKVYFDSKGQPTFDTAYWKKEGKDEEFKLIGDEGIRNIEVKKSSIPGIKYLGTYTVDNKETKDRNLLVRDRASLLATRYGKPTSYTYVDTSGVHTVTPDLCKHLAKRTSSKTLHELKSKADTCNTLGKAVSTDKKNPEDVQTNLQIVQKLNLETMKSMEGKKFVEKASGDGLLSDTDRSHFFNNEGSSGPAFTAALKNAADVCISMFPDALEQKSDSILPAPAVKGNR